MRKRTILNAFVGVLGLFYLALSFVSCQLGVDMHLQTNDLLNDTRAPLLTLTKPTNNQIVANGMTISGSFFDESGIMELVIYTAPTNGSYTNTVLASTTGKEFGSFSGVATFPEVDYYTIWVWAKDRVGNAGYSETRTVYLYTSNMTVDSVPPTVTVVNPTNNQSVGLTYSFSGTVSDDNSGVDKVYVRLDNADFGRAHLNNGAWSTNFTVSSGGVHTNYVYAIDKSFNISATNMVIISCDAGLPWVNINTPDNYTITANPSVTVGGQVGPSASIVSKIQLTTNSGASYFEVGNTTWSKSFTLSVEGTNSIMAMVISTDNKTNTSTVVNVIVDTVKPVSAFTAPTANQQITNNSLNIEGTASDDGSGLSAIYLSIDGSSFVNIASVSPWSFATTLPYTNHSARVYSVDRAGNIGNTNTVNFTLVNTNVSTDNTPPTVNATPDSGNYGNSVSVTLSASDNMDTSPAIYYSTNGSAFASYASPINIVSNTTILAFFAKDVSNNYSATNTNTYVIEIVNGLRLHFKKPAAYSQVKLHYWNTSPSIPQTTWPGVTMVHEGNDWYVYTITNVTNANIIFNNAGAPQTADLTRNKEGWYKDGVWYDANPEEFVPPTVQITSPASGTTVNGTVLITANASDNVGVTKVDFYRGSTIIASDSTAPYSASWNTSQISNATYTIYAIAFDAAGNRATNSITLTTSNPNTPPTANAGGNMTVVSNIYVTFSGSASTDPNGVITNYRWQFSGASPQSATLYGMTVSNKFTNLGTSTVTLTVWDNEGASHSTNITVTVTTNIIATRWDPRQETIYFLLTSRWFDGDPANSVGDEWCSWTSNRGIPGGTEYIADNGFTGPEDVTWRGDFKGLVEKMDYIKALGFTAIWITPIVQNRSPLSYHGYHGWDFNKEDARLVSPGYDFQRVIDEAHNRGMKICLDIVINHSGRYGIKDFAEIKYNTDTNLYPEPTQPTPNWEFDGLTSPGMRNGVAMPPYARYKLRPFNSEDLTHYPYLATDKANGFLKYQWPSTESYCKTIDGVWENGGAPGSLTYEQYKTSKRRIRGHNTGFPTGSASFDNYPDTHFDSLHEDCPDLNTENPEVQQYLLNAYYRYIDMGVDMFRVDTVMHMHKKTLNEMYWPQLLERANQPTARAKRGNGDFFIFGEVANFVMSPFDKQAQLREQNYTWDNNNNDGFSSANHYLNGNNYRTPDYSKKAPNASSPYMVSIISMVAYNQFVNGAGGGYGFALGNDHLYNDATYLVWYADSHDYGPNKGETRYQGDFASVWSMIFTFRGIPVVYYGSEIRFKAGKPNDWPGGGASGVNMSLEKTGRGYYGPHLAGTVTATDFGKYSASGEVANTLNSDLSKHLRALNKIRLAVPALQMGQYSTEGCSGGMASFKRRYVNASKGIDSFVLVGVGQGNHSYSGVPSGTYVDLVTGNVINSSGSVSFNVSKGGDAGLGVYVLGWGGGRLVGTAADGYHAGPWLE